MLEQSCALKHFKERTTDKCEGLTRRSSLISTDPFYTAWQHSSPYGSVVMDTVIDRLVKEGLAPFHLSCFYLIKLLIKL